VHDSIGWIFLLAAFIGGIWNARSKRFHRAYAVDIDYVGTEKDPTPQGIISSKQRMALLVADVLLALIGVYLIQRAHNWNPFAPA
jgi:4-hydroxybenzoate polyprenyltransferase